MVPVIEIMDDPFINSIEKILGCKKEIDSPYLFVYPDIGNVSAWHNDVYSDFILGIMPSLKRHEKRRNLVCLEVTVGFG